MHGTTLPHRHPLTTEAIVTRADPSDAVLLVVRSDRHRDCPIGALPLDRRPIRIVVEPPNFGSNTTDKLLDNLNVIFEVISMGKLIDALAPGDRATVEIVGVLFSNHPFG